LSQKRSQQPGGWGKAWPGPLFQPNHLHRITKGAVTI
jgi:hypothetical protein